VLAAALKMAIFGEAMQNISSRECWNDIVVHLEVRGILSSMTVALV